MQNFDKGGFGYYHNGLSCYLRVYTFGSIKITEFRKLTPLPSIESGLAIILSKMVILPSCPFALLLPL